MENFSIETLLLRHYGVTARPPIDLEQRLYTSVRQEVEKLGEQQQIATALSQAHVSQRQAASKAKENKKGA